jgi:hypothetical protein
LRPNALAALRALGPPAAAVIAGYVVVSIALPAWPMNIVATGGLFMFGLLCCGWAAARAKSVPGTPVWVAMVAAFILSIVHLLAKAALLTVATDRTLSQSGSLLQLALIGIVYTLPLTLSAAWIATREQGPKA